MFSNTIADQDGIKDPLRKKIRFFIIRNSILLIVWLGFSITALLVGREPASLTGYLFTVIVLVLSIFGDVHGIKYWKRIEQRRHQALNGDHAQFNTGQPAQINKELTLPVHLQLRSNLFMPGVMLVLLLLSMGLLIPALFIPHLSEPLDAIFFAGGFLFLVIFCLTVVLYFGFHFYQEQYIEITEEGITTRYMRDQQSIQWHDARLFSTYDAEGTKKNARIKTYELTDGKTIVRWSQQPLISALLSFKSNTQQFQDWNESLTYINSLVAHHTHLPLLDFSDKTNPTTEQSTLPEDPMLKQVNPKGNQVVPLITVLAMSVVMIAIGFFSLESVNSAQGSFFQESTSLLLIVGGVLGALGTLLLFVAFLYTQRYLLAIHASRQQALHNPEQFQAHVQPTQSNEAPIVQRVRIRLSLLWLFGMNGSITFILVFVCGLFIFRATNWWIILLGSLGLTLFSLLIVMNTTRRAAEQQLEIKDDGIMTHMLRNHHFIPWSDARLFATYRGKSFFNRKTKARTYELISQHTIARWPFPSPWWRFEVEPKMSEEEYDRWLEQVNAYVSSRTGLPLLDLDTKNE